MPDRKQDSFTGIDPRVLMASLSYVGILVLLPLFSGATKDTFVAFHVRQGLLLLAGEIIAVIAASWFPYVGGAVFLLLFIASIIAFFRTMHEERWSIPLIGFLAEKYTF